MGIQLPHRRKEDDMPMQFKIFSHVHEIDREEWNQLAQHASPTMEWEYYRALEESESVSEQRGYKGCHLVAYSQEDGKPVALAPLYERDRAWVEFGDGGLIEFLSELTGLPFHRGLVGTIPFTPIPGYQFLHRPGVDATSTYKALLNYIDYLCEIRQLSTSRIYFVSLAAPDLHASLIQQGYVALKAQYYLWFNRNYLSFEDYLGSFRSGRRTKIRRERRSIGEGGIEVRMVEGTQAPARYYEVIFDLYVRTWEKHMGSSIHPFLNREFFQLLGKYFRHRTSFSVANRSLEPGGEEIVAMALFYKKSTSIYGRYWGCFEEIPFLHFATCYYSPIDYAIGKGIQMMDPGFGGEHKLLRGYEVVPVYHYVKFHGQQQRRIANAVLKQMGVLPINVQHRS
jgi:uncharacterized protein